MANLRVNEITTGVGSYNGSIYATGTSSYLFTTVTAPGTDDFTIECYINTDQASGSNQDGIFAINASSGGFQSNTNNQIRFTLGRAGGAGQNGGLEVNINGTAVDCGSNDIIQEGTWHHVAVTRASGTVKIWVDGVEKASGSAAGDVTGTTFITGYYDGLYTYQGFMSNFRYRKGTAHYTTTFTAPTKPLERTTDTELIFAQSPHNAGNGFSSAIHGGTTDIMQVNGNVTANESSPTQLSDTSAVGVVYDGPIKHNTQGYMYFPTGRTEERGGSRGILAGGFSPSEVKTIDFFNLQSTGNALAFGDLTDTFGYLSGYASHTRAVFSCNYNDPAALNTLEFITIATQGNSTDFGDRTVTAYENGALSNETRGLVGGGYDGSGSGTPNNTETIDFNTIASLGNSTDFGDLTLGRRGLCGLASPTRGVFAAGYQQPDTSTKTNVIDFVTIASTGNASNFGDLVSQRWGVSPASSATRGIFAGGASPSESDSMEFITIASTGDTTDFGDLTQNSGRGSGTSDSIRGVFKIGYTPSTGQNTLEFVTIATTGNAQDFGDSISKVHSAGMTSNAHGGLS